MPEKTLSDAAPSSEECLAVYCLSHSASYSGLRVLELGGGMTGLAGLLLAATGQPDRVTLTDGNLASAESLQAVVSRNSCLASRYLGLAI